MRKGRDGDRTGAKRPMTAFDFGVRNVMALRAER
jgi:hypothetical protein